MGGFSDETVSGKTTHNLCSSVMRITFSFVLLVLFYFLFECVKFRGAEKGTQRDPETVT